MYPSQERPASGTFVWQQAEQLRRFGHRVDVVNILGFRSKLHYLKGAFDVIQATRTRAYDIVHAHYGLSAFPAWFRLRPPLVITLHGSDVLGTSLQRCLSQVIWRSADRVIVVSQEIGDKIPGTLIPCGVDLKVFRPHDRQEARSRLGWPTDKALILFPFDPARRVKRYDLARASVELLNQQGADADLVSVSSVENSEMPWYYSAADVMILCSDSEGSPTAVKEALACNLPVVATNVGDVPEILRGIVGSRICLQSVSELACGLREVIAMSRRSAFQGRKAMARYDQERTVQKIVDVYEDVLRSRERKRSA
jgi:teichuronic acid biosynthesis glycosyltransferase TuaC